MEYDYYERTSRRAARESRRGFSPMLPVDLLMLLLTIVVAAALLCGYLAPRVSPLTAWPLAFAGLVITVLYVLNLLMLFYWTVRWRAVAFVPLACVLLGAGVFPTFYRLDPGRRYDTEIKDRAAFRLVTFNVEGFAGRDSAGGRWGMERVGEYLLSERPDVLCMQEFTSNSAAEKDRFDDIMSDLPYSKIHFTTPGNGEKVGTGLAIYSRYPIVRSGIATLGGMQRALLWADLRVRRDTLRVLTTHLQSTSITESDREYIDNQEFLADVESGAKFRGMLRRLRGAYMIRAAQADTVAMKIAESPYRIVVCGDFNDTPVSYTYRTIRGDMDDTFGKSGCGVASTYRGFYNMLRIDYILHSESIETLTHAVPDVAFSDHRPVVATLRLTESK